MADVAQSAVNPSAAAEANNNAIVFSGNQPNMAAGIALLLAGGLAFTMGMTDVYFARAMAWTFVVWGVLFIYNSLMDVYQTYEVGADNLTIRNPLRPWDLKKVWDWGHIHRLDVIVKRNEPHPEDIVMQVYFTPANEVTVIEREDRQFDAKLAQIIIERSGLKATDKALPADLSQLSGNKGSYVWNRSGRLASS
jgi:hypothetical protein